MIHDENSKAAQEKRAYKEKQAELLLRLRE